MDVLREEIVANERDQRGLLNRPRYQKALTALKAQAPSSLPQLLEVLDRPLEEPYGPDHALAETIVEVLGSTGDPQAVDRLVALLGEPIAMVSFALADSDLGTAALLRTAGEGDRYIVRANAVQGLGASKYRLDDSLQALEAALQDESPHVRHAAAMALIDRPGRTSSTVEALRKVATGDSEDWVRTMAEKALR